MHSIRASMQSVTAKRTSNDQHHQHLLHQQQQQQQQQSLNKFNVAYQHQKTLSNVSNESIITTTSSTTSSSAFSDSVRSTTNAFSGNKKSLSSSTVSKLSENYMHMGNYAKISFDSLDGYGDYAPATRVTAAARKTFEHRAFAANQLNHCVHESLDDDAAAFGEDDEVPPALPIKIRSRPMRRDRHPSQYDNVDHAGDFSKYVWLGWRSASFLKRSKVRLVMIKENISGRHFLQIKHFSKIALICVSSSLQSHDVHPNALEAPEFNRATTTKPFPGRIGRTATAARQEEAQWVFGCIYWTRKKPDSFWTITSQ